ncbi:MAG: hypothetical protein GX783_10655 [Clostridiales bacterium]|nr:hypothetical protein [Clostridiales bacterium]
MKTLKNNSSIDPSDKSQSAKVSGKVADNVTENVLDEVSKYINNNFEDICTLAMDISKIPSMTGNEGEKANYILGKLKEFGCDDPYIDEVGNVIYLYNNFKETSFNGTLFNGTSSKETSYKEASSMVEKDLVIFALT